MPVFAFVALLLTQFAESARDRLERQGLEAVRDIAEDLDRDIASQASVLQTLSFSTRLADKDFRRFHELASQIARNMGLPVVLSDPSGQQIVNTRLPPYGAELPRSTVSFEEVVSTRKPVISDLFFGAVAQAPIYALAAPVFNESGDVAFVLSFSIDPARIYTKLQEANLAPPAYAGVIDRNGRMMARTVENEKYLNTIPKPFLDAMGVRREGQSRLVNRDGSEILASFTRMKSTGWTVAYGVPVAVIDQPVRGLVWQVLALGLVTALIAGTGGFVYSRRIVGALDTLGQSAGDVGHGRIVEPVRTSVAEINEVGTRLALASRDLRQTTDAKDSLLYEVNHRVKNSLAVVTSLLAMQVRQTPDESLRRGLDDLRARINVIASVHQRLYESGLHDRLDLGLFLHDIAADMIHALGGARYRLVSDCDKGIIIGVDRTTPVALILGELLTNAIKHGARAEISLSVKRADHGRIRVVVADDGPGLPADFGRTGEGDMTSGALSGMGMKIVSGLVRQVRGQLESNAGEAGARFQLTLSEAVA